MGFLEVQSLQSKNMRKKCGIGQRKNTHNSLLRIRLQWHFNIFTLFLYFNASFENIIYLCVHT